MREQVGFDASRLLQQLRQTLKQLVIGERLDWGDVRHASSNITRAFSPAWQPLQVTIAHENDSGGSQHRSQTCNSFYCTQARILDNVQKFVRSCVQKLSIAK
jgi:hypothetical protein